MIEKQRFANGEYIDRADHKIEAVSVPYNECIIKIRNQLGADYVLLGDIQQSNDVVKVDAQLFQVSTNRQVWATEEVIPQDSAFSKTWPTMTNDCFHFED